MRILVITPFFPPDVSVPAAYAKKLVTQLSQVNDYVVTCLHYGSFPEQAGTATLVSIQKNTYTPWRLLLFAKMLWQQRHTDVICILNGPSVELPFLITRPFFSRKSLFIQSDPEAVKTNSWLRNQLWQAVANKASGVITPNATVLSQPFTHPLHTDNTHSVQHHHDAWSKHVKEVIAICQN